MADELTARYGDLLTVVVVNLEKKVEYINDYSFHLMDPDWGHMTIKFSGHPPFGARSSSTVKEYVACAARTAGLGLRKGTATASPTCPTPRAWLGSQTPCPTAGQ